MRDDYLGDATVRFSVQVYKWSKAGSPALEVTGAVKSGSFSVTNVYQISIKDLLKASNCSDRSECVVRVEVTDAEHSIKAENFYLLTEPKDSKISDPKLKVISVKKRSERVDNRNVFDIELSAESIAPFVVMDFKPESQISGQFVNNGFFVFDTRKTIAFETESALSEQQIRDNLLIKTLTDVK